MGRRSRIGGSIAPAMPFAASMTTRSGLTDVRVDERQDLVDEARVDVPLLDVAPRLLTPPTCPVMDRARSRMSRRPGVAADRKRAAADDLHARVLLGIVGGGDRRAAVEPELADGEVEHLGADHPDVDDVGAGLAAPRDERLVHRGDERRMSRPTAIDFGSNCST